MVYVQNTAGVHAWIALCGTPIGRRSVNMFGCVKTDCVQHLNKLVVQQAERGWRFRLLWAEAVEVSVEGFLLEQAGLVGT